jgi:3-oxoacyl-[acyl-carrier protein] reductase
MQDSKTENLFDRLVKGKNVIVTGAGKGIGRETALLLARSGANVCLVSRTKSDVNDIVTEVEEDTAVKVVGVVADVSKPKQVGRIVSVAAAKFGRIDCVVCAAGYPMIPALWNKGIRDLTTHEILDVFNVDVLGSFLLVKEVIPLMVRQRSGVIVLFSSTPALGGYDKGGAYGISKSANLGLVKSLASEYGKFNVRAYAIAPGNIKTDRTFNNLSRKEKRMLEMETPMQRWGEPREVANVVVSLVSDRMSFVTGQTIVVDGGTLML